MTAQNPPASPCQETSGMVYFARLCSKIRLFHSGELDADFHPNLGKGMDLWTCQFLHVDYEELKKLVIDGATDQEVLEWCFEKGVHPNENELAWWSSYMRNAGFRDHLSEKLAARKEEAGWEDWDDIQTFFNYLDADDGRL